MLLDDCLLLFDLGVHVHIAEYGHHEVFGNRDCLVVHFPELEADGHIVLQEGKIRDLVDAEYGGKLLGVDMADFEYSVELVDLLLVDQRQVFVNDLDEGRGPDAEFDIADRFDDGDLHRQIRRGLV